MLSRFSRVWLFVTLWTVDRQAPLSMAFSRQEYWSVLLCPVPGDLPGPGIEPVSLKSPTLAGRFFTTSDTWEALRHTSVQFSSVAQLYPTLRLHELQHVRPPCPSPTPGVYSNSYPSNLWCHPTISSSVIPFSSRLQSFPASGSFPVSQFFTSGGQSIRLSALALVLPMNIQDRFPLGLIVCISLQSKGLSRVFSTPQFKSINSSTLSFLYGPTLTSIHEY